jgi:hypothetical protein
LGNINMSTRLLDDGPSAKNFARGDRKPAPVEMPDLGNNCRANGTLWLFIVLCLACDFLMMPIMTSINGPQPFAAFLGVLGCVLAQGNLLAAWLAWSEGPLLTRLITHWTIAALLYLVWAAGFRLSGDSHFSESSIVVGLFVPLVSLAAQTPLWIARQSFGWRLVRGAGEQSSGRSPLTIRRLMLATLVAAATFGLARSAPPIDNGPQWPMWAFAFVVAGGFSTLAILPASAMLMRTQQLRRGLLLAALHAASYVAIIWLTAFTIRHFGWFTLPPLAVFVGISSFIFSFAATVMLAAVAARSHGYQLNWGRK